MNADELRARITAGQRILDMQAELQKKNQLVQSTLTELQALYDAIDRDLIEARKLQHSLIREPFQALAAGDVSLSCGLAAGLAAIWLAVIQSVTGGWDFIRLTYLAMALPRR